MYKLGIDVGGTNTDAVIIDDALEVIASCKSPTTPDITSGIQSAMAQVLEQVDIDRQTITQAMLGTTQCTNAIVERRHLAPIAVVRIGAPATAGIPPMVDWPGDIQAMVVASTIIGGGYEFDGKDLAPLDEAALREFLVPLKRKIESVAISCVFATIRTEQEERAAAICKEVLGDIPVSISSEIGDLGLIERENATILNAALYAIARTFTEGFMASLQAQGVTKAQVYLSQNDGTLMTVDHARRYPILTIACGPTNSIRGASFLSHRPDALVVDVGGTTTDIGVIQNGFPRESSIAVTIGDVRTNFRMPDVLSIGLGGGSIVRQREDGRITVGPDSVGYRITEAARVFGGDTLTATDIAVRLGLAHIGDAQQVADLDEGFARQAMAVITAMVEDGIDAMKLSAEGVDVILVGGGSVLLPDVLEGAAQVLRLPHAGVANAIGSAISKVSATYEQLINYEDIPREDALANARKEAITMAEAAGAKPGSVEIIEQSDTPLAYYPGNTNRIKIKAAGDLGQG
ncbi:hydantoinase/oxoprolinase family protein [Eubacterium sp.]|uniref:hydantoinase/oxoprolinase family protein n=1 Tax=Eubacterium sp. TaxID=142586 RepID=UPI002FCBA73B